LIIDHRHVAHRLDGDDAVGRVLRGVVEVGVAGEVRLAVDADAARAADRGATRAADADRGVGAVACLEDSVEDGAMPVELDLEVLPVGRLARLGRVAPDSQRVIGHQ
jgi:hypothetical protein